MDQITKKSLLQHFELVPEDIQNLIVSDTLREKLTAIASRFNLSKEQTTSLKNETMFVLLGFEFADQFSENLQKQIPVEYVPAEKIFQEVNERIFRGVEDSLEVMRDEIEENDIDIANSFDDLANAEKTTEISTLSSTQKEILNAIENPIPSPEKTVLAKPGMQGITVPIQPPVSKPATTFMDEKLSKFMKSPNVPTAAATEPKKIITPDIRPQQSYKGPDPYRESA